MSHKLLLVDDSITIQKVVELILAEEDFEIKSTSNGEEALAVIPSFQPDIVLADIEMPKMNGYQLCEKINQDPSLRGISVILLAGVFEPIDEELAKQVKSDDYIIKPFESQELMNKINAVLTISPATEEEEAEETIEVAAEELQLDKDLWAMEELPEATEVTELSEAIPFGTEEPSKKVEAEPEIPTAGEEILPSDEQAKPTTMQAPAPEGETLSTEEMKKMFENTVSDRISSLLSSLDIKEVILDSLTPILKDSIEKVLRETAPDLTKRMLKSSIESLIKEGEKVIWETIPDIAETMISKEIERIKSEF